MPTLPKGTVEADEIWKRFRADDRPTYLADQIAAVKDRIKSGTTASWRWVLSDVNFRAEPGQSWGLIGANGAGKSTLLKMLTRVMYPTAGHVTVEGRVGALIEVRAGISPLLTGRENIYLTGSIMGLKRDEVAKRFDEIVTLREPRGGGRPSGQVLLERHADAARLRRGRVPLPRCAARR